MKICTSHLPIKKRIRKEGVTSDKSDRPQSRKGIEIWQRKIFWIRRIAWTSWYKVIKGNLPNLKKWGRVYRHQICQVCRQAAETQKHPCPPGHEENWPWKSNLNRKFANLIDLKKQIHDAIDALTDPKQRLVLRYRYIEFFPWGRIIDEMKDSFYSERQIYRFHSEGLKNIKMTVWTAFEKVVSACQ